MHDENVPNIFILLGIDPNQPWNQAEFERLLQEKRREWAKDLNIPNKRGIQAKQNLGLIPAIQKIAADPAIRQAQAKAANQTTATTQKDQLAQLEVNLDLLQRKGYLVQAELDQVIREFKDLFKESEIRKKVRVEIRAENTATKQRKPTLETATANVIKQRLEVLKKTDLYEFMGMDSKTAAALLRQKASDMYKDVGHKATKTADDTTAIELYGHCINIFASDTERAKYDETLRMAVYEDIKKNLDLVGRVRKVVEASQVEFILMNARKQGLNMDETIDVIRDYAISKSYSIEMPANTKAKVNDLQLCGYCKNLNTPDQKYCTLCGEPLQEPCPKCGQAVSSDSTACGACGFLVGNRSYVLYLISEVEQAIQKHDTTTASELLTQIQRVWPAGEKDRIMIRLSEIDQRIKPEQKLQRSALEQLDNLIQARKFFEARLILPQLAQFLPTGSSQLENYRTSITSAIQQAESHLARAKQMNGSSSDQVISAYQDALRACQDCQEARDMLARTPPLPPSNLSASVSGSLVHLAWQPSSSSGVNYSLVRKEHGRPVSANDGKYLGTVSGTILDDKTGDPGILYFYAVFSNREGVFSKEAAIVNEPILLVQEIDQLTAEVQDGQIFLSWKAPKNVHEVVVVRSETTFPVTMRDGSRIGTLDINQAVDNNVQNGRIYYYTVFCQFQGIAERPITTAGKRINAIPQPPPTPIQNLEIVPHKDSTSRKVNIQWDRPDKGDVAILYSQQPTGLKPGAVIRNADLPTYGELLRSNINQTAADVSQMGVYYYTPLVLFHGMAYVGKEHRYVSVEDVTELKIQNLGYALRLTWNWPASCNEVKISYSNSNWPSSTQENNGRSSMLTRAQYELYGYYDFQGPAIQDYFFIVFAAVGQADQKIFASGLSKDCRARITLATRITLDYQIKKSLFGKDLSLELTIQGQGVLPALLLVRKHGNLPMNKQDGNVYLRIEKGEINKKNVSFSLPVSAVRGKEFVKLFLVDDFMYDSVIIHHPLPEKLKLP